MPNILHTESSEGWGGQELRIIQESLEFIKRGYRMMIACQPGSRIHRVAQAERIPVVVLRMRAAIDPLAVMRSVQVLRTNSIDLVHTHSSIDSWCFSMGAKAVGIPVVRSRHVSTPISTNCFSFLLYMKLAGRVITSAETIRRTMIEMNGYDPRKIISIPAGVDEKRFLPGVEADYVRKDLNIRKDDFLLGVVAILRSWKGHSDLLEAMKILQNRIANIKLLIVGSGPQERNIREYIRNNGLAEKVIMTGYRDDVPQILKCLDLFILPSYSNEATSQVIPQAMAMGIPVISTSVGGIGEVVTNGQTGMLVPPRDVRALSETIYWVYQHRDATKRMADRAREFILNGFTFTGMIEKTEKVYRGLLKKERLPE
jgi:glycosyltransferase involved in cell wall biosynthesis